MIITPTTFEVNRLDKTQNAGSWMNKSGVGPAKTVFCRECRARRMPRTGFLGEQVGLQAAHEDGRDVFVTGTGGPDG